MALKNTGGISESAAAIPAATVAVWEQDPGSGAQPDGGQLIFVPVPNLAKTPLPLAIQGTAPPAKIYAKGTPEFRYWDAAAAGRRGADFWGTILPHGSKWHATVGTKLTIRPDQGVDLNAFYDRTGLSFFHDLVAGRTVFSGESPDILCHEMGHAVLDAIRPQLWDVANFEVPAFHESFGDMSAILTGLQVPSLRVEVLSDTGGRLFRSSRLSRLAEQLGWAIRQSDPADVEPDCLRNAVNAFVYQDPMTLPDSAPSSALSREPHSLSRVFTSSFFEGMGGMLSVIAGAQPPTEANLLKASVDMAGILIAAILQTPVVPTYFSQVAAHMVAVATAQPGNPYADALKSAFVRHGILSLQTAVTVTAEHAAALGVAATVAVAEPTELPTTRISMAEYGLTTDTILVHVASEPKRFDVAGAAPKVGSVTAPAHDDAAKAYVDDLMRRGRLDLGKYGKTGIAVNHDLIAKTHELVEENDEVYLRRVRIYCGFDCR